MEEIVAKRERWSEEGWGGVEAGVANTGAGLEVGDIVRGFKEQGIFWEAAQYTGGDPTNRAN